MERIEPVIGRAHYSDTDNRRNHDAPGTGGDNC